MKQKEHSVDAVIKHNGWDGSGATFPDLAIIKLARKVKFNLKKSDAWDNSILPACLPTPKIRKQLYNTKAFVAGNTRYVHYTNMYKQCLYITAGNLMGNSFLKIS